MVLGKDGDPDSSTLGNDAVVTKAVDNDIIGHHCNKPQGLKRSGPSMAG